MVKKKESNFSQEVADKCRSGIRGFKDEDGVSVICMTGDKKEKDYYSDNKYDGKDSSDYSGGYSYGGNEDYTGGSYSSYTPQQAHITSIVNTIKYSGGTLVGGVVGDYRIKRNEKLDVNYYLTEPIQRMHREKVVGNEYLQGMVFHHCYLTGNDMDYIINMPDWVDYNFKIIDFSNNLGINDLGIQYALRGNCSHDDGIKYKGFLGRDRLHVVKLDLSNCNISDGGASLIAEALSDGKLASTKYVNLSGNNITKEGDTKLVQALKGLWKDFAVFTHTLDEIVKMGEGTKEEKVAIYKAIVEKGKTIGTYDKAMVVDKSWFGKISHIKNEIFFKGKWLFGFTKCHVVPDPKEVATSYGQDKIIAALPEKTASGLKMVKKGTNVLTKHYDFVTCFVSSTDEVWASELGQQIAKYELCLLGEQDFCGGE